MIGVAVSLSVALLVAPAFAAHPAESFHALDGNVMDITETDPPYDWDDLFNSAETAIPTEKTPPAGVISADFTRDFLTNEAGTAYVNGDDTYFATGSKDTLSITPGWQCKHTNNATDKGDFANGYGYAANVMVGGTNHIIFFFGFEKDDDNGTNNLGVWLLQNEVGCEQSGGGNQDFTGDHADGDLLAVVSYDSGGSIGTARGFKWVGDDNTGHLNTTPAFSSDNSKCGASITSTSEFCIITNSDGAKETPWWSPQKGSHATSDILQKNVFVEGFLDITNVFGPGNEPCFAGSLADTRSSTAPTATIYDFLEIEAPTCGPLVVEKYFDKNADGVRQAETEPLLSGWEMKVFDDGADPAGTPLYSGNTNATTPLTFSDVPFGAYDVYETQQTGYYATDPGSGLKKDVAKGQGTDSVIFGNACFVDATFTVTNVPSGVSLDMRYSLNGGAPSAEVAMTADGTSRTVTINDTFKPTDSLTWEYALAADNSFTNAVSGGTVAMSNYTDTSGVGTACAKADSEAFPYATLTGHKFKDINADGVKNGNDGTTGLGGFVFTLHSGSFDGSQVGSTSQSAASTGVYTFTNVPPGTYYVTEAVTTGWQKTLPVGAGNAGAQLVTVDLGDTAVDIGDFLNAPLTDIQVTVSPDTTSSYGNISCTLNGNPVGTDVTGNGAGQTPGDDDVWTLNDQLVGQYICTIDIIDP